MRQAMVRNGKPAALLVLLFAVHLSTTREAADPIPWKHNREILGRLDFPVNDSRSFQMRDGCRLALIRTDEGGGSRVVVDGVAGPRFAAILVSPVVCADGHLRYLAAEQTESGPMLVAVEVPGFGFN
jgi:hypothetical protein